MAFIDLIDLPEWRPLANAPNASAAGVCLACDRRNNTYRHPEIFQLASAAVLNKYSLPNDEWLALASPGLAGTFGAGACAVLVPEAGPSGTIGAGGSTSSVPLSTALPAAVGVNQLANRGDGLGFVIRVIGSAAGSSGKTEERRIIANTEGTTPTVYLGSPLSFTPANGDRYEILAGRVFLLSAGTVGAGTFKYYDIATNSFSGNLSTTNLPASIGTDSEFVTLSEQYVPHNRLPGEGFLGTQTYNGGVLRCLQATGAASGTLTGQASGGDAEVEANEYRNFQLRIVEDTGNPTAVGQRRRIASHTAGPSPVYTLSSSWTVTPSATAKYVLEGWGDSLMLFTSAVGTVYNYSISGNAWDTSTWAARGQNTGAGVTAFWAFGIVPDNAKLARHSQIFSIRGGAVAAIDLFDIAGAATGSWSTDIVYGNKGGTFTTGTSGMYDPISNQGRYGYINVNGTQRFARFDVANRIIEPLAYLEYAQGAAVVGIGLAVSAAFDGATKYSLLTYQRRTGNEMFQMLIQR